MPLKIDVYSSKFQKENFSTHISDTRGNLLMQIFPHFSNVSDEVGQELTALLARGYDEKMRVFTPVSFVLMVKLEDDSSTSRILWLSNAALVLLKQHTDLYEVIEHDDAFIPLE